MRSCVALAVAVLALVAPSVARAATPAELRERERESFSQPHFAFGVGGAGALAFKQSGPRGFLQPGGGLALSLGARITQLIAVDLAWSSTYHDNHVGSRGPSNYTVGLQAITLDGRLYPVRGRVQPFASVGGGAYLLTDRGKVVALGGGFGVGGGVDIWLKRWARFTVRVQYRGVGLVESAGRTQLHLATGGLDFVARF